MSDHIVVWNGRDSLTDGAGWAQKQNTLLDAAPGGRGDWLSQKDTTKAVKAPSWRQANAGRVQHPPAYVAPQRAPNRLECTCGRRLAKWEIKDRRPRCWRCTKARAA